MVQSSDFETRLKAKFLSEARRILVEAEEPFSQMLSMSEGKTPVNPDLIHEIFRFAHNLKGTAAAAGFEPFSKFVHHAESLILKIKKGTGVASPSEAKVLLEAKDEMQAMVTRLSQNPDDPCVSERVTPLIDLALVTEAPSREVVPTHVVSGHIEQGVEELRVQVKELDSLVNLAGELMVAQLGLNELPQCMESYELNRSARAIERLSKQLHEHSLRLRLGTVKPVFLMMGKVVRDTAKALGKEIEFQMFGEGTELDKTVLDELSDPLMHLMRNAVDHGIESGDAREKAGKPRKGKVRLSASRDGAGVVIEVSDDGVGLDASQIVLKAKTMGILAEDAKPTEDEAYQFIFAPGFSTKESATEISGRGVGMDVVKTNITKIQGQIEIETAPGIGTLFRIRLPKSLATLEGWVVRVGEERYVIPHAAVVSTSRYLGVDKEFSDPSVYRFNLATLLGRSSGEKTESTSNPKGAWIKMKDNVGRSVEISVDELMDRSSLVLKKLEKDLQSCPWIMGGVILGDGKPAVVLNVPHILEAIA